METFKEIFRDLRKEKNLTQKQLGQVLNVDQSAICAWEKGRNQPDYEMLIRCAEFFDTSVDFLLGKPEARNEHMSFDEFKKAKDEAGFNKDFRSLTDEQKELVKEIIRNFKK